MINGSGLQSLLKSLVKLMQEHHISKISVRACANLQALTKHFLPALQSYDLLAQVEQEVLENLNRYLT